MKFLELPKNSCESPICKWILFQWLLYNTKWFGQIRTIFQSLLADYQCTNKKDLGANIASIEQRQLIIEEWIHFRFDSLTWILCKDSREHFILVRILLFIWFLNTKWDISRPILKIWFQGNLKFGMTDLCYKKSNLPKRMTLS